MPKRTRVVIGGVDTHGRTHHAAVIDQQGRLLGLRPAAWCTTRSVTIGQLGVETATA
jgi:hypothetical protein